MISGSPISAQTAIFTGDPPIPIPGPVKPTFMFLEDHYIAGNYILAGTIAAMGDGTIPANWIPTPNVDPLNDYAVQVLYAAGPGDLGLVRQQFERTFVPKPVTYWKQVGVNLWALTGLGSDPVLYPAKFKIISHPVGNIPQ